MKFQTLLPISYLPSSVTEIKKPVTSFIDSPKYRISISDRDTVSGGWNRKQCVKFNWISKQLKKSTTTSEGVYNVYKLQYNQLKETYK